VYQPDTKERLKGFKAFAFLRLHQNQKVIRAIHFSQKITPMLHSSFLLGHLSPSFPQVIKAVFESRLVRPILHQSYIMDHLASVLNLCTMENCQKIGLNSEPLPHPLRESNKEILMPHIHFYYYDLITLYS